MIILIVGGKNGKRIERSVKEIEGKRDKEKIRIK